MLEVVLRMIGFGNYPLYYESDSYEYALVPNQSIKRFGNTFYINQLGMRSSEIKSNDKLVLGFGDSVLNGGVALSQDELASSILDSALAADFEAMRFTNTSAGSWGVSNAFYWFKEKSLPKPEAIVLVFSSHDYDDKMEFQKVVGEISFYPKSSPKLAITDALEWLYSRYIENIDWSELAVYKTYKDDGNPYDSGWDKFIDYAISNNIPLVVYHHPNRSESLNGEWNEEGKKLEKLLNSRNVKIISGLLVEMESDDYRDDIHTSSSGQKKIARAILPVLKSSLKDE